MKHSSKSLVLAVLGGDQRYVYLVNELIDQGVTVKVLGFANSSYLPGAIRAESLFDALLGTQVLVLPMAGLDDNGCVNSAMTGESWYLSDEAMDVTTKDVLLISGIMKDNLHSLVARRNIKAKILTDDDTFAVYNSIPTAEGALLMAMENSDITIHGSNCYTLGYGRCGKTIAKMVRGLGANSFVAARKSNDIARIYSDGFIPVNFADLKSCISKVDFIFNTVPAPILTRSILKEIASTAVIIDIASSPGGTDFVAAQELGIKAELAPSLPGKIAPKTSGKLMSKVVWDIISTEIL